MVAREVPFVGTSTLLYNWKNIKAFFKKYELKTLNDFDKFWQNTGGLGFEDLIQIVSYGLQRKDKEVTLEEAEYLFDEFMEDHTLQDIVKLVMEAQLSALVNTDNAGE